MILAKRLMMCLSKIELGDWIVNPIVTINDGIAHYTAYKTNQHIFYDSYADLDVTEAIVRSLHNENMQQWQAVIDSINQLTGVSSWQFDLDNQWITYEKSDVPQYTFRAQINSHSLIGNTLDDVCAQVNPTYMKDYGFLFWQLTGIDYALLTCKIGKDPYTTLNQVSVTKVKNPNYNVTTHHLDFITIAEKTISNASSPNQGISLLAEAYLENMAQSIFSTDESKQFVKIADLINQFELNKVLRA